MKRRRSAMLAALHDIALQTSCAVSKRVNGDWRQIGWPALDSRPSALDQAGSAGDLIAAGVLGLIQLLIRAANQVGDSNPGPALKGEDPQADRHREGGIVEGEGSLR